MQRHPRQHDEAHLKFIRSLSCLACGDNTSTEAAHIRRAYRDIGKRETGKSEKPDDIYTVPLCGECHRKQHDRGETQFWYGVACSQPSPIAWLFLKALALACASGDAEMGEKIVRGDA